LLRFAKDFYEDIFAELSDNISANIVFVTGKKKGCSTWNNPACFY